MTWKERIFVVALAVVGVMLAAAVCLVACTQPGYSQPHLRNTYHPFSVETTVRDR